MIHSNFMRPAGEERNFAGIPGLVRQLLTGGPSTPLVPEGWPATGYRFKHVITLLVDAFGWCFFERFQDHPLLRRFGREGSVTRLTAQFPSTTAAHVTTLYTGLPVSQHGVFEWFYYEPVVDDMIAPLLFARAGDDRRESLGKGPGGAGIAPEAIYPRGQVSRALARKGVASLIFQPYSYFDSTFSRQLGGDARRLPYLTVAEGLSTITENLARRNHPAWLVGYFDSFDMVCHMHGPDRPASDAELDAVLTLIERWLQRDILGRFEDILVMIIADHGQTNIDPADTLYLDRAPGFRKLRPLLRTNRRGAILAPAGSARDFFVYAQPDHLEEAQVRLTEMVKDRGEVRRVADMLEQGCFGPAPVADVLRSRLGNLVVLPYAGQSVFWWGDGRFEQKFCGHHGGLTARELEIPLLILPL